MKVIEIILDKIGSTRLFEMARSRKDAKDLVTNLSPQIINHLIKLFVFNLPNNKSDWIKEINGWLHQINDIYLKPSNKKPEWDSIYGWMIFDSSPHYNAEYVNSRVKIWLATDYSDANVYDYDADVVLNQILIILERTIKDISVPNKFITIKDYLGVEE